MYVDYNTLMHQKGFSELSENAKDFLKKECELLEIRFCNACGKFTSFGLYEDNSGDNTDWCSEECMETTGYTFKDMLVDFYDTPIEGEEYLFYKSFPLQVALLRGTTADENGNIKEGGITVEGAVLMPEYIKADDQKKLFDGCKLGDVITFNPKKAYPESDVEVASLLKMKKEEVADLTADFSYQITEISRYVKAEVNQELFDQVFGKDAVKDEQEFRSKIAEGLKEQFVVDADFKFIQDVRKYMEEKVGALVYPDALLKRVMLNNNKDKGQEFVDKNYDQSIKELTWHLIKEQLVNANGIKIDDADVKETAKEAARAQFAQYGMTNIPEEYIDNYATDMLKKKEYVDSFVDRSIDRKLTEALKKVVKLNEKTATLDEFNKLMQGE